MYETKRSILTLLLEHKKSIYSRENCQEKNDEKLENSLTTIKLRKAIFETIKPKKHGEPGSLLISRWLTFY